ncbi:DEAD/DEAH box helicase [Thorsellia anophelis]|uniref:Helicase conserved C-terminal domain-containing protein n=1 Tax=Thorsellia anophelis DSM 18579 TaxID=1123402 RepID=A0A1I0C8Y8_9GAMM|nr:DEAD/DEAH box helicase [Thorsellia anophelis]SET15987.1 Helicase conserved C-terminal domain-containing protein [Thorsellia anophelis DSM 18579]
MHSIFSNIHNNNELKLQLGLNLDKVDFYTLLLICFDIKNSPSKIHKSLIEINELKTITHDKIRLASSNLVDLGFLTINKSVKSGYELTNNGFAALIVSAYISGIPKQRIKKFHRASTSEVDFFFTMLEPQRNSNQIDVNEIDGLIKFLDSDIFWQLPLDENGYHFYSNILPFAILHELNSNRFSLMHRVQDHKIIKRLSKAKLSYDYINEMGLYSEQYGIGEALSNPIGMDYLDKRASFVKDTKSTFGLMQVIDIAVLKIIAPKVFETEKHQMIKKINQINFTLDRFFHYITSIIVQHDKRSTLDFLTKNYFKLRKTDGNKKSVTEVRFVSMLLLLLLILSVKEDKAFSTIREQLDKEAIDFALAQPADSAMMRLLHRVINELYDYESQLPPLFATISKEDRLINELLNLKSLQDNQETLERVVWIFDEGFDLSGKIQKQTKSGWSSGRVLSFMSIWSGIMSNKFEHDDADIIIASYANGINPHGKLIKPDKKMLMLVAKSNKVFDESNFPIIFEPKKQLLLLTPKTKYLEVNVYPESFSQTNNAYDVNEVVIEEFHERYFRFNPSDDITLAMINSISKANKIKYEQKETILSLIKDSVDYYDESTQSGSITLSKWDETPHLWLSFANDIFNIEIEHQTEDGNLSTPTGDLDKWLEVGSSQWTVRNLDQEKMQLQTICEQIGVASDEEHYPNFLSFSLSDASTIIEKVSALEGVKLHWRKGSKRLQVVNAKDFTLSINEKGGWFTVTGGLQIDGAEFIQLKRLLAAKRTGYIELEQGNVQLILSKALQEKVNLLDSVINENQEVEAKLAYPLQKLIETMQVESDKGWQKLEKQWQKPVKVDKKLLVPLREYQRFSVNWAIHLLTNGFGVCLADDMGLGKTIQSLKIIEHFAKQGPSLVIAPKSVLHNWEIETIKFAPSVNAIVLDSQVNKEEVINQLKPNDLLIVGYSQAPLYEEALNALEWQTVVLDEAQNIKNPTAKRTQALMNLNAKGKMTLSGTPIENHLIELWSQFAFINPGLLGTLNQFKEKYGQAAKDERDMARLRALVSPFIMRRLKKDVLTELPEKIEINHTVSLTQQEFSAYEAVRQTALHNAKTNPIELLAALTRLRQICCDPFLVFKDKTAMSSKLEEAMNLIREGIESGHRILVFSQFVALLGRLEGFLKSEKIELSYLDGKTSLKKRETEIERFKSGKSSVFLISLKAGGTGLNLTEADMVIHLDPWWNPAVEDQATDRAHRMGQTQPVTIYRLVTENTIEEKIIALHQEKRDLAEKVLSGQDGAQKLDPALLLSLLSD